MDIILISRFNLFPCLYMLSYFWYIPWQPCVHLYCLGVLAEVFFLHDFCFFYSISLAVFPKLKLFQLFKRRLHFFWNCIKIWLKILINNANLASIRCPAV